MTDNQISFNGKILHYDASSEEYPNTRILPLGKGNTTIFVPENSLRFIFGIDPATNEYFNPLGYSWYAGTWTHVSGRVWDWTYNNPIWSIYGTSPFKGSASPFNNLSFVKLIGANCSGVTNMNYLFKNLTTLDIDYNDVYMDTRSVTSMESMFENCKNIRGVPLMVLTSVLNFKYAFKGSSFTRDSLVGYNHLETDWKVPSSCDLSNTCDSCTGLSGEGCKLLYDIWSPNHTGNHSGCFRNCAVYDPDPYSQSLYRNIPSSWK